MIFKDKKVLITGGTGSLGKILTRRLLSGDKGTPKKIIVFSRDEAKQHYMRLEYLNQKFATDEVIYNNFKQLVEFVIGDVRNYHSVAGVLKDVDIVINAAALKQVPTCEYFPYEATQTNILGPQNIITAIKENGFPVETVVGVSTDKACKPVNVMGMTKSIQERVFIGANISCPDTRFICVRYGNVLASRGSVIPLFHAQIKNGGPVTITTPEMTRFLMPLDKAVDIIFKAIEEARAGDTYIPKIPAAKIVDVANVLIGDKGIKIDYLGLRPGEKIHEILISEEEGWRTEDRRDYYAISAMLPELSSSKENSDALKKEYSSADELLQVEGVKELLEKYNLLLHQREQIVGEMLK